jgi:hypothetical protein
VFSLGSSGIRTAGRGKGQAGPATIKFEVGSVGKAWHRLTVFIQEADSDRIALGGRHGQQM